MPYGQAVIGPPGSGKTTYCHGVQQFKNGQNKKVAIINLDPGNDILPYDCYYDIKKMINTQDVMISMGLGPNGALLHCMKHIQQHFDDILDELSKLEPTCHLVFDLPGQVELFTADFTVQAMIKKLEKAGISMVTVHLVDAIHCLDSFKFLSVAIISLQAMMMMECPHLSILSKIDLIKEMEPMKYPLELFIDCLDLRVLVDEIKDDKLREFCNSISEVISDCAILNYLPLAVEDKKSMAFVLGEVSKSNGEIFSNNREYEQLMKVAMSSITREDYIDYIKETYVPQCVNYSENEFDEDDNGDDNNENEKASIPLGRFNLDL